MEKRTPKVMASLLFYHIIWPHGGSSSELIASNEERLSNYREATKFDKYQYISAKDHERMRPACVAVIDLSIASHLPKKDAIIIANPGQ